MGVMSQKEREAARDRVVRQLGVGRIGAGDSATPIPPREGSPLAVRAADRLPIEEEITQIQAQYGYGEVWGRPGLPLRTRSFITMGILMALNESDQMGIHINNALNIGITPEEVHEALLHAGVYGGLSAWHNGFNVARYVFVARGILKKGSPASPASAGSAPRIMTQPERDEARERGRRALGVGKIGTGKAAPAMTPMAGSSAAVRASPRLPVEEEISKIQAQYGYGEVWGRPGLPLRERSFITVGILAALRESDQLHIHINNALNLGITPEEVHEALLQAGVYGGLSAWHHATNVARDVFVKRGILKP